VITIEGRATLFPRQRLLPSNAQANLRALAIRAPPQAARSLPPLVKFSASLGLALVSIDLLADKLYKLFRCQDPKIQIPDCSRQASNLCIVKAHR
jgi:hypothetical protein